jgi:hypothetical protein
MDRSRSRFVYPLALALLWSGVASAQWLAPFDETGQKVRGFEDRLMFHLMKGLVVEHHLPHGNGGRLPDRSPVVYILGGTQESLEYKCKTVGQLYAEGVRHVLTLHRPGITEFSPALGRNFTNDEWLTGKLKEAGVAVENVEFVPVPFATFDTFAEARVVSTIARSRKVKQLVLVSSTHHTKRVWLSFSHFNADNAFESYTYGSEERAGTFELLMENMKLRFYMYFVFPIDRLRGHFSSVRVALRTEKESFPEKTR